MSPFKALMNDSNYYILAVNEWGNKIIPSRIDRMEDVQEVEEERVGYEIFNSINLQTHTKEILICSQAKEDW